MGVKIYVYFNIIFRSAPGEGESARAHLPSDVELVVADKVGVVTLKRVEDERLVRLWDLAIREPSLVRQVHFCRQRTRVQARCLGVHLQVYRLGRLDAEDELVARDIIEDTLTDVLELDPHFHLGFVQGCNVQKKKLRISIHLGV